MWSHPTPRDLDFLNFESTLPEDAFTRVLAFLAIFFSEKKIFKDLLYIFLYKTSSPPPPTIVANPTPRDHDFHNFEYTLPEDASTQV